MPFWKKKSPGNVKENLKTVEKQINSLGFEKQPDTVIKIIGAIQKELDQCEADILKRAQKEKNKPWIHSRYDSEINQRAQQEVDAIEKLKTDLAAYAELASAATNEDELSDVVAALKTEAEELEKRDKENEEAFDSWSAQTLRERLQHASAEVPAGRTEGVTWSNIVKVARQFGGWAETGGSHDIKLVFPAGVRPVPLSSDMPLQRLASQIRAQLTHLPQNKIPSAAKIRVALRAGDIKAAA